MTKKIGFIFQIIPWEKKGSYIVGSRFNESGEYDLLHIALGKKEEFKRTFTQYLSDVVHGRNKNYQIPGFPVGSYRSFTVWIKRPHDFKLWDEIEAEVNITKTNVEANKK